jgi:hypothetical protein
MKKLCGLLGQSPRTVSGGRDRQSLEGWKILRIMRWAWIFLFDRGHRRLGLDWEIAS